MSEAKPESASLPLLEFLVSVDRRRRTYAEAMDAWRSTRPRHMVWEDAIAEAHRVIELDPTFTTCNWSVTVGVAPEAFAPFADALHDAGIPTNRLVLR